MNCFTAFFLIFPAGYHTSKYEMDIPKPTATVAELQAFCREHRNDPNGEILEFVPRYDPDVPKNKQKQNKDYDRKKDLVAKIKKFKKKLPCEVSDTKPLLEKHFYT